MSLTPIAPETVSSSPSTLILKETAAWKSLSNDSGKIKDTEGNLVFEIDAAVMTMSGRRALKDASGKEVGQVRHKKTPGVHPAMYVGTMDDDKKCMVKTTGMLNPTKCDADIYVGDSVVGEVSGNWRAKHYTFTIDGKEVSVAWRNLVGLHNSFLFAILQLIIGRLHSYQNPHVKIRAFFRLPLSRVRPALPVLCLRRIRTASRLLAVLTGHLSVFSSLLLMSSTTMTSNVNISAALKFRTTQKK